MMFLVLLKVSEKALDIEAMFLPTSIYGFHCAFKRATSFHIQIKLLTVLKKINSFIIILAIEYLSLTYGFIISQNWDLLLDFHPVERKL